MIRCVCDMDFREFLLGLVICFLLSFSLGIERQIRRRFLGLRTMILVAVGSYLFVSFSFLITGHDSDVTRIAAQVVAGIGFLGAGVIIKDNQKSKVKGLTTAATLWCDASIGVLCAGGFIREAIVASCVVLFANIVLRYINAFVHGIVEERSILETYSIIFNVKNDKVELVKEAVIGYINKCDYLETDSYEVSKDRFQFDVIVRKSDLLKLDKFINKIVGEYDIVNYGFKKISESKLESNEEL